MRLVPNYLTILNPECLTYFLVAFFPEDSSAAFITMAYLTFRNIFLSSYDDRTVAICLTDFGGYFFGFSNRLSGL